MLFGTILNISNSFHSKVYFTKFDVFSSQETFLPLRKDCENVIQLKLADFYFVHVVYYVFQILKYSTYLKD